MDRWINTTFKVSLLHSVECIMQDRIKKLDEILHTTYYVLGWSCWALGLSTLMHWIECLSQKWQQLTFNWSFTIGRSLMIDKQIPDDVINEVDKLNFRVIYLTSELISVVLFIYMGSLEQLLTLIFENVRLRRHFKGKQLISQVDAQIICLFQHHKIFQAKCRYR